MDVGELSLRAETTLTEADQSYHRTQGQSFVQYLSTSRGREAETKTEWLKSTRVMKLVHKLQVCDCIPQDHFLVLENTYFSFCVPQAVGCPYLEGMDEAVVSEVVLVPGEARMRVLTWLTGRLVVATP